MQMRERVWQSLKDVDAIEHHVRQQNVLNRQMKQDIAELEDSSEREKQVIQLLINKGMQGIADRIDLLKAAVEANVTGVKLALHDLDNSLVSPGCFLDGIPKDVAGYRDMPHACLPVRADLAERKSAKTLCDQ